MKLILKISIALFVLRSTTLNASAQNLYIHVVGGYNFVSEKDVITTNVKSSSEENIYGSYGRGVGWGAGVGYMLNKNVGGEVNFSMYFSPEYRASYSDNSGATGTQTLKGSIMQLSPTVRITAGNNLKPFCKFGLVIGLNPKMDGSSSIKYPGGSGYITDHNSGGTPLGFTGSLGLDTRLNDLISFCAEINFISLRWAPEKDKWSIQETDFGTNKAESGSITYVDKVESQGHESYVFHVPDQVLKSYVPFSSFGFTLGIQFSFGIKKAEK